MAVGTWSRAPSTRVGPTTYGGTEDAYGFNPFAHEGIDEDSPYRPSWDDGTVNPHDGEPIDSSERWFHG